MIVSGYPQTSNRTDVAFSPMLEMKGGVEYTIPAVDPAQNPKIKYLSVAHMFAEAIERIYEEVSVSKLFV